MNRHFQAGARNFSTGMAVELFFVTEESGVSMTLPVGTSRVTFSREQFVELRHKLAQLTPDTDG